MGFVPFLKLQDFFLISWKNVLFVFFQKKSIFYLVNPSLNCYSSSAESHFHYSDNCSIFSDNQRICCNCQNSGSGTPRKNYDEKFDQNWNIFLIICNFKISWYKTKMNWVNLFLIKCNLICLNWIFIWHSKLYITFSNQKSHIYIVFKFEYNILSLRIYEIMEPA